MQKTLIYNNKVSIYQQNYIDANDDRKNNKNLNEHKNDDNKSEKEKETEKDNENNLEKKRARMKENMKRTSAPIISVINNKKFSKINKNSNYYVIRERERNEDKVKNKERIEEK